MKRSRFFLGLGLLSIGLLGCKIATVEVEPFKAGGEQTSPMMIRDKNALSEDSEVTNEAYDLALTHQENASKKLEELSTKKIMTETELNQLIEKTKNYILTGQEDQPEAKRLKWSSEFLNQVDFSTVYENYLTAGGESGNIESFANYLTQHAPINEKWEELTKQALKETYEVDVIRFEKLDETFYQAYVMIEGKEVPYVTVNIRTGYYHG